MSSAEKTSQAIADASGQSGAATQTSRTRRPLFALAQLPEDWQALLSDWKEPTYRANQLFKWIFVNGVLDPNRMTSLPRGLRERLTALPHGPLPKIDVVHRATDGTRKLLVPLADDCRVECVLIPMIPKTSWDGEFLDHDDDPDETSERQTRVTLCVSTQYGCAMGCVFCQSGRAGLKRGLHAEEIVAQVLVARQHLDQIERLTNLVFMGMGEPLHHYDATTRALRVLTHPEGLDMSLRRITVSTVGLVPGIQRLGQDFGGKVGLAISLHAPTDALRDQIIPINRRYPLRQLMDALHRYPLPRRRRITIEYTLIAGFNDGLAQARQLSELLRGLPVKINLIPMNCIAGSDLRPSSAECVAEFQEYLARDGYSCFVRTRRGDDVAAACGQLAFRA